MNSDIKPDFEKLALRGAPVNGEEWFVKGCHNIWTDYVEPMISTVKRLQEENERLKEAMTGLMNEYKQGADSGDWGSWKAEDQPEYNLCETVLKQLES